MTFTRIAAAAVFGLALSQAASADPIIYSQPWAGAADMYSSQNDTTPGGFGNFATVFDDFKLSAKYAVTDVHWTGGYFNPGSVGPITRFTVAFYADAGGTLGAPLYVTSAVGTAGETSIGSVGGFPMATYVLDLPADFMAEADTRYWVSIVPDLAFPPQWGIASGTGGNGAAIQDFLGTKGAIPDLAFELSGVLPEPGSIPVVALALLGLAAMRRKTATV